MRAPRPAHPRQPGASGTRAFLAVLTLLSLTAVGALTAFADRGLDISDEGIYLLAAQDPQDVQASVTAAHHYTALLFRACSADIPCFRISGMTVLLLATALFSLGAGRLMRCWVGGASRLLSFPVLFAFASLGSLLFYTWLPPSPSYNLVNTVAMLLSGGLACLGLSLASSGAATRKHLDLLCFGAAGMAACLMILAKLPSGVLLLLLHAGVIASWPGLPRVRRWRLQVSLLAGLGLFLLLHHFFVQHLAHWWTMVSGGLELARRMQGGHGLAIIPHYVFQSVVLAMGASRMAVPALAAWYVLAAGSARRHAWMAALICLAVLAGLRELYLGGQGMKMELLEFYIAAGLLTLGVIALQSRARASAASRRRPGWLLAMALVGLPSLSQFDKNDPLSWSALAHFGPWLCGVLLLFVLTWRASGSPRQSWLAAWHAQRELLLITLILLALPVISVIGTNNPLATNMLLAMAPWFACLALWAAVIEGKGRPAIPLLLPGLVAVFAAAQVGTAQVSEPYRLEASILAHTVPTELGEPASTLRLPPRTHRFITDLRSIARRHGMQPGDDVIALVRMPGLVFALGGRAPAVPWFVSWYPGSRAFNEHALQMIPSERRQRAFLLISSFTGAAMPDLAGAGIDLASDYEFCGELVWPVSGERVQLWRPYLRR